MLDFKRMSRTIGQRDAARQYQRPIVTPCLRSAPQLIWRATSYAGRDARALSASMAAGCALFDGMADRGAELAQQPIGHLPRHLHLVLALELLDRGLGL